MRAQLTSAVSDVRSSQQLLPAIANTSAASLPDAPVAGHSVSKQPESSVRLEQQSHPRVTLLNLPANALHDGGHIAISPKYIRWNDLKWMVPLAGAAAAAFANDHRTTTEELSSGLNLGIG